MKRPSWSQGIPTRMLRRDRTNPSDRPSPPAPSAVVHPAGSASPRHPRRTPCASPKGWVSAHAVTRLLTSAMHRNNIPVRSNMWIHGTPMIGRGSTATAKRSPAVRRAHQYACHFFTALLLGCPTPCQDITPPSIESVTYSPNPAYINQEITVTGTATDAESPNSIVVEYDNNKDGVYSSSESKQPPLEVVAFLGSSSVESGL